MKLLFYDTETTGTNFWQHGIHQIGGCIEIDGVVKEYFDFKIQPNPAAKIDDKALEVSNVTREQISAYMPFSDGYKAVVALLSKYINKYDKKDKFFRAFFVQNGDEYFGSWFWFPSIDVMILSGHFLIQRRIEMSDFKQKTVAKYLGIDVDESKLHDAEYDVSILMQIFKKVILLS